MNNWEDDELSHNPFASSTTRPSADNAAEKTDKEPSIDKLSIQPTTSEAFQRDGGDEKKTTRGMTAGSQISVAQPQLPVQVDTPDQPTPHFQIDFSEPMTLGEGMKAHTVYKITTQTTSQDFRQPQFHVHRRFREFLWLQEQLTANNPGIIVPPSPAKHALGRFDEDFVEQRRLQLETMLRKCARHAILHKDRDFIVFMESENLQVDMHHDSKASSSGGKKEKSSLMSKFSDAIGSNAAMNSTTFVKIAEQDEYFDNKRVYFETLDTQLKAVSKSVDAMIKQRLEATMAKEEFGEAINTLSTCEINKSIARQMELFAKTESAVKDVYAAQLNADTVYLSNTFDEYNRLMGSVISAFNSRAKAYQVWQSAEQHLVKLRISLEKTKLSSKTKPEKVSQLEADILDAEGKVVASKKEYEEVCKVLRHELEVFERGKVGDIHLAISEFMTHMAANQKKIVSLWEGFMKDSQIMAAEGKA